MSLSVDELRNGLAPELDFVFPAKPANPEMREGASVWLYEENGAFGFPRLGLEAESANWELRPFTANFALEGGRALIGSSIGKAGSPLGPEGRPTVLDAGPLSFRCVEPFRRWIVTFEGPVVDTDVSRQIDRSIDVYRLSYVKLEAELTMAVPAWIHERAENDQSPEAAFMGLGVRYEQLFRAEGVFTVDGQARPFKGSGLRIKRQSIRRMEGFNGHVWQSAVFPDGRAFGLITYPPKGDGSESYNEAFVYQDGRMFPAKVVDAPWLRRLLPQDDDVSVELDSELGRTRIGGATRLTHFRVGDARMFGLTLQQGGALYEWDGQSAYGMIERSSPQELVSAG